MPRIYGEIADNPPGTTYASRREVWERGVHREFQGGISGDETGAESIVISGGYADDEDHGDVIVYTGQGGRDPNSGRQIADQELTKRNLGLARCHTEGLPVRVIRGADRNNIHAPATGYRYDGLYYVSDYWHKQGLEGFRVWQFRLAKSGARDDADIDTWDKAPRVPTTVQRIVRSTKTAAKVKKWHDHTCQICGLQLRVSAGPYAEAAHIRALGTPHHGPDTTDNIICLCPNHHVLFDNGGIFVDDNLIVRATDTNVVVGNLRTLSQHVISLDHLRYHRNSRAAPDD